jgi:hypothetical protein
MLQPLAHSRATVPAPNGRFNAEWSIIDCVRVCFLTALARDPSLIRRPFPDGVSEDA